MSKSLEHPQYPPPLWTDVGIATWGPDDSQAWVVANRTDLPDGVYVHHHRLADADEARTLAAYLERAAAWLDWPDDVKVTSAMLGSRERYAVHDLNDKIIGHVSVDPIDSTWRAETTQDGEPVHAYVKTIKAGAHWVLRRYSTMG